MKPPTNHNTRATGTMLLIASSQEPHQGSHLPFLVNGLNIYTPKAWPFPFVNTSLILPFAILLMTAYIEACIVFCLDHWGRSLPHPSPFPILQHHFLVIVGLAHSLTLSYSLFLFSLPSSQNLSSFSLLFPLLPLKTHIVLIFKLISGDFRSDEKE